MVNRRCRRGVAAQARRGGRAPPGDCCGSRGHVRMAIGSDHAAVAERWFERQAGSRGDVRLECHARAAPMAAVARSDHRRRSCRGSRHAG